MKNTLFARIVVGLVTLFTCGLSRFLFGSADYNNRKVPEYKAILEELDKEEQNDI